MRQKAVASGVKFRPHVKTHKTAEIARMQHGGALGPITVSTLAEAEFFADASSKTLNGATRTSSRPGWPPILPPTSARAKEAPPRKATPSIC